MTLPGEGIDQGRFAARAARHHALVSAQATFLPIPQQGQATFWPVIFNYQSSRKNPAVLTLLVTRQGTSMTIVDNARDTLGGDAWGQRLFFNKSGQRAPLTAERLSDVKASGVTMNGEIGAVPGRRRELADDHPGTAEVPRHRSRGRTIGARRPRVEHGGSAKAVGRRAAPSRRQAGRRRARRPTSRRPCSATARSWGRTRSSTA